MDRCSFVLGSKRSMQGSSPTCASSDLQHQCSTTSCYKAVTTPAQPHTILEFRIHLWQSTRWPCRLIASDRMLVRRGTKENHITMRTQEGRNHHLKGQERSLHAGAPGHANHVSRKPWFACVRVDCRQFRDCATMSLLHASAVGCANSESPAGLCSDLVIRVARMAMSADAVAATPAWTEKSAHQTQS